MCHADLLINLSDVDGLFDSDPHQNPNARLIGTARGVDEAITRMAGGAGTARGTGGMATKLSAAKIVLAAGIPMIITNGKDPRVLYELLEGKQTGTLFLK